MEGGDRITLPIAGRSVEVRIVGIVRDYARTWGAALIPLEDYREITGDMRVNDMGLTWIPAPTALRCARPFAPPCPTPGARHRGLRQPPAAARSRSSTAASPSPTHSRRSRS
jgi:hypothetical protein